MWLYCLKVLKNKTSTTICRFTQVGMTTVAKLTTNNCLRAMASSVTVASKTRPLINEHTRLVNFQGKSNCYLNLTKKKKLLLESYSIDGNTSTSYWLIIGMHSVQLILSRDWLFSNYFLFMTEGWTYSINTEDLGKKYTVFRTKWLGCAKVF